MFGGRSRSVLVGLEVGTSKIKVAVAELDAEGSLSLLGVAESPSTHVRKCEITDFEMTQKAIHQAILDAEAKTAVSIGEVYLAISGAHIRSFQSRLALDLGAEGAMIEEGHLRELRQLVRQQALPPGQILLHDLLQTYILDDGTPTANPVGLLSRRLMADYHLVSGIATRLQTTIHCVTGLSLRVKGYALSSYATAQALLAPEQKSSGAVVVNCGAGITDYIVYRNGYVAHSGTLGVGGDHLTNDLAVAVKIPFPRSEELKKSSGTVEVREDVAYRRVSLPAEGPYEQRFVPMSLIVDVLRARQAEIFEIIREDLEAQPFWESFSGTIILTGGGSRLDGVQGLAGKIFDRPVQAGRLLAFDGEVSCEGKQDWATVLGLLRYGRIAEMQEGEGGRWNRMGRSLRRFLSGIRFF
ncbi:Cell division protein FtsA [Methylacidimicrobium cyclopophantes]|uniref:Cell division protein FtsA n=1 Tax=Methylacidimicrobium cyclopophantes TaxID=1041766 RepID=A0A5E6MD67_9BACT|nr:cell division protein FtsA [Methylacidimicrobium cyclopophantes]VVM05752.1 Cell division protein FtsA [Methylacidimicrobium cyclopophantes]